MCFLVFIVPPIDLTQENNSKLTSHVYFGHHSVILRFGHRKRVKTYLNVRTFHWALSPMQPLDYQSVESQQSYYTDEYSRCAYQDDGYDGYDGYTKLES